MLSFIQNEHNAIFVRWNEAAKETAKFIAHTSQVRVVLRASEKIVVEVLIVAMILVHWLQAGDKHDIVVGKLIVRAFRNMVFAIVHQLRFSSSARRNNGKLRSYRVCPNSSIGFNSLVPLE